MSPLIAPVFAQLITVGVQAGSEARHVKAQDRHWEAEASPGAALILAWRRNAFAVGYGASFLGIQLEEEDRQKLIFHNAWLNDQYRFRRTTVSLNGSVSWGEINFQVAALQPRPTQAPDSMPTPEPEPGAEPAPDQPSGTPTMGADAGSGDVAQTRVVNRSVSYLATNAGLSVSHQLSRELTLNGFTGYTVIGGLDEQSRADYPTTRGLHVGAQGNYVLTLSAQDSVTLDVSAQQAWSSLGNRLTSLIGNTLWTHKFDGHTSSTLGAGLSNTRFSRDDGLIAYSVFPTFAASIDHTRRLWRGQLGLNLGLFSNPVMDTLRATIDPRIGASSSISYAQGKFSSSLNGTAAISVAPEVNNTGAFDTYTASLNCAYDFVDEAGVTAGARMMKQQFQGTDLIPLSYAVFLGLRLGYARKLNGL